MLRENQLWWNGPSWLSEQNSFWPQQLSNINLNTDKILALQCSKLVDDNWLDQLSNRVSSFRKIVKVITLIKQLAVKAQRPKEYRMYIINNTDIFHAEYCVFRYVQIKHFGEEISRLKAGKYVSRQSCLRSLNPFIDAHGILRVGGRISKAMIDYNVQHPIILSSKSEVVKKLVEECHIQYRHAGPTLLHSIVKQRFFIIGGRLLMRSIYRRCVNCRKARPVTQQQLMANLPEHRVQFSEPFSKVGVDYAGPFMAYYRRARGQRPSKIYVCVFVCLATKAVHIEVACDLTTEEFLGAWKRMTARRGLCCDIYSDCGSNFVGANKLLIDWYKMLKVNTNVISECLLREKVNWHFNPASAPHFGGIWEAAVKSFKTHLRRVVGQNILTVSEFNTLVTEIEGILNSRPLCRGDDEVDMLTPAHFLIGRPITCLPEPISEQADMNYFKRWQLIKQMVHHFWIRWHKEYLVTLQHRYKWQEKSPNLKINDIVMIKDENLVATRWSLGRVTQIYAGSDNLVRTVTLKTQAGIVQRPIHKFVKLPMGESIDSRGPTPIVPHL